MEVEAGWTMTKINGSKWHSDVLILLSRWYYTNAVDDSSRSCLNCLMPMQYIDLYYMIYIHNIHGTLVLAMFRLIVRLAFWHSVSSMSSRSTASIGIRQFVSRPPPFWGSTHLLSSRPDGKQPLASSG